MFTEDIPIEERNYVHVTTSPDAVSGGTYALQDPPL